MEESYLARGFSESRFEGKILKIETHVRKKRTHLIELPPEGIVGSEVGSAEGLVRDVGSGIFTTIFSLPSFLCVLLYIYLFSVLLP